MNALFEHVGLGLNQSIKVKSYQLSRFDIPYHFHPEFEMTWVKKSTGFVHVNNSIVPFEPGDVFVFGSNLPHIFMSEGDVEEVEVLVIQFSCTIAGSFESMYEFSEASELLSKSRYGLKLHHLNQDAYEHLSKMEQAEGVRRIVGLLQILDEFSRSMEPVIIDFNELDMAPVSIKVPVRLQKVLHYIMDNYSRNITLEEIAAEASMNKSAFCRDFKKHTRRTLTGYINDLRVEYACKLLIQGSMNISSIGYKVGFNSLTYFNRVFKERKLLTPHEFRAQHTSMVAG